MEAPRKKGNEAFLPLDPSGGFPRGVIGNNRLQRFLYPMRTVDLDSRMICLRDLSSLLVSRNPYNYLRGVSYMKKVYVFVDESYNSVNFSFYILSVVWTEKNILPESVKNRALERLSHRIRRRSKFHFRDDSIEVRKVFLEEILKSKINFGVLLFNKIPKTCEEYADFYVANVINSIPVSNSLIIITIKGIGKGCDLEREAIKKLQKRVPFRVHHTSAAPGSEIADYIASAYRLCLSKREDFCEELEKELKFKRFIR